MNHGPILCLTLFATVGIKCERSDHEVADPVAATSPAADTLWGEIDETDTDTLDEPWEEPTGTVEDEDDPWFEPADDNDYHLVDRRASPAAVTVDDKPMVLGGEDETGTALSSVETWESGDGAWRHQQLDELGARSGLSITLTADNKILVFFGKDETGENRYDDDVVLVDPATGAVTFLGLANPGEGFGPRYLGGATMLPSGNVALFGGSGDGDFTAFVWQYDPSTTLATHNGAKDLLQHPEGESPMVLGHVQGPYLDGIVVHGGAQVDWTGDLTGEYHGFVGVWTPNEGWHSPATTGESPSPRAFSCATTVDNHLYLFGGRDAGTVYSSAHRLNLSDFHFEKLEDLPGARSDCAATYSPVSGEIFVIGGRDETGQATGDTLRFTLP
jgi:N-acetylneuraminic acid mutarotase